MAENENPEQQVQPEQPEQPGQVPAAEPAPPAPAAEPSPVAAAGPSHPRLIDRAFTFRSVLAVGVATLLLGGAGGAAIVAATDDDHDDRPRIIWFGDGPGRQGDGPRFGGGPWGNGPDGPRNAPDSGTEPDDAQPGSGSTS